MQEAGEISILQNKHSFKFHYAVKPHVFQTVLLVIPD